MVRPVALDVAQSRSKRYPPAAMQQIARTLRQTERFELDGYRQTYVVRRLASRLSATGATIEDYARRLRDDAAERKLLVESLGINVTSFFRDPGVWRFLEDVALPPLLDERMETSVGTFRALSLGCAGGQEAYSLAMLLAELLDGRTRAFHIDAWDMDGAALDVAREAWYPASAISNLSRAAAARYLDPEGAGFRVKEALRSRVDIRRRDMLTEGLTGTFDLVLMRNVLIYFAGDAKERLFQAIHDCLAPRGLLLLGQSETMSSRASDLFRPLSLRNRVYARVER